MPAMLCGNTNGYEEACAWQLTAAVYEQKQALHMWRIKALTHVCVQFEIFLFGILVLMTAFGSVGHNIGS